ncbi:hypothetical protein [Reyranella sp.]|uniref:hypothetical protein n=1 Tax=Reyranella sp. TaxID=1929291 RepID=UPI003BAC1F07
MAFNVLHFVLFACALLCVRFTLGEVRHRPLTRPRLWAPSLASGACALTFAFIHLGTHQPPWIIGAAAAIGLTVGLARGFTLPIQVDQQIDKVRLPRARASLGIALVLLAAVIVEIAGSLIGTVPFFFRQFSPEIATLCACMFIGRAFAIRLRWRYMPYVDLHRV